MANTRYTTPTTTPVNEIEANQNIPAGQAGSPWQTDAPAPTTPAAPVAGSGAAGSTRSTPPPVTTDPVAAYYNGLRDYNPATDDQAIKDKAAADMQASLDAIDAKYVSIFAQDSKDAENRTGQTRAQNSRGGLLGSDFGTANDAKTTAYNKEITAADQAQKDAEVAAVHGKIDALAQNEIAARKQEALGKVQGLSKLQDDARALIPQIAASGTDLSDAQKTALQRQSGYDDLTFTTIFNASKPKAQQVDWQSQVIKNDDGSVKLLMYGTDPVTGQLLQQTYDVQGADPGSNIKVYDGRPYTQVVGADGSISLKPVAGYIQKPTGTSTGTQTERDRAAMAGEITDATAKFAKNLGKDQKVDPGVYSAVRADFASRYPDQVSTFDKIFQGDLSDTERKNLGLSSGTVDALTQLLSSVGK